MPWHTNSSPLQATVAELPRCGALPMAFLSAFAGLYRGAVTRSISRVVGAA